MFIRIGRFGADQKILDRAREARKERLERTGGRDAAGFPPEIATTRPEKGGDKGMIRVTRLNGEILYLNLIQIQGMESIPETKIKMMNGDYYLVKDTPESVIEQIRTFFGGCLTI